MNYKCHFFVKPLIAWIIFFFFTLGVVSCETMSTPDPAQDHEKTSQASTSAQDKVPPTQIPLIHDIGTIWNGTFVRHVFVLENNDTKPWEIRNVIEGQGVRIPRFNRLIPPGGKGEVVFEVSTRRLKGKIRKTAQVHFKIPRRPPLDLMVTGEVRTSVVVAPEKAVRFKTDKGKTLTWHFLVTSPRKKDFTIQEIKTFTPHLKSRFHLLKGSDGKDSGHVYDLTVTLTPDTPIGRLRDLVKIHTDIPDGYPGEIPFSGMIQGTIIYSPRHIKFAVLEDGTYSPARISLSNRRGTPFTVIGMETDSPDVQWKVTPFQDGRAQVIDLFWIGEPKEKLQNGKLVLLTDVVDQERIEVPYVVFPRLECQGKAPVKK